MLHSLSDNVNKEASYFFVEEIDSKLQGNFGSDVHEDELGDICNFGVFGIPSIKRLGINTHSSAKQIPPGELHDVDPEEALWVFEAVGLDAKAGGGYCIQRKLAEDLLGVQDVPGPSCLAQHLLQVDAAPGDVGHHQPQLAAGEYRGGHVPHLLPSLACKNLFIFFFS